MLIVGTFLTHMRMLMDKKLSFGLLLCGKSSKRMGGASAAIHADNLLFHVAEDRYSRYVNSVMDVFENFDAEA